MSPTDQNLDSDGTFFEEVDGALCDDWAFVPQSTRNGKPLSSSPVTSSTTRGVDFHAGSTDRLDLVGARIARRLIQDIAERGLGDTSRVSKA